MALLNYIFIISSLLNNFSRRTVLTFGSISAVNNLKEQRYRSPILYDDALNKNININHDIINLPFDVNNNNVEIPDYITHPTIDSDSDSASKVLINVNDNNIYYNGPITPESCFYLQQQIQTIIENNKNIKEISGNSEKSCKRIKLHIQSVGGSLLPTFGLVDFIKNSEIPIDTYISGFVASAGSIISVSGSKRYMTKNSMMLIHSLRTVIGEVNYGELEDHYLNSKSMMNIVKGIYKEKSTISNEKLDFLLQHDYWLNSTDCLKYKLVDYVI